MLEKELSMIVISLASLATLVPSPIDSPTWAAFKAGASFVPSPVTATTCPSSCRVSTRRFLSIGRARDMIFKSITLLRSSSSLSAANSGPVICWRSPSVGCQRPICRPISRAVPGVSPVTILIAMPASRHSLTAAGTSLRTGSAMATMPMNVSPSATTRPSRMTEPLSEGSSWQAKPSVRMAWFW